MDDYYMEIPVFSYVLPFDYEDTLEDQWDWECLVMAFSSGHRREA